jgi:sec-independent protein translocase protein TatA
MGIANPLHIAVLLLIVLLVFGAKRLPELGRALGGGIKEFKGSIEGVHEVGASAQEPVAPTAAIEAAPHVAVAAATEATPPVAPTRTTADVKPAA